MEPAISSSVIVDKAGELAVFVVGDGESSIKPMPGVNGGWLSGGRVEGSSVRRQESARTPARRMNVPRAIYDFILAKDTKQAYKGGLLGEHEGQKVANFDRSR